MQDVSSNMPVSSKVATNSYAKGDSNYSKERSYQAPVNKENTRKDRYQAENEKRRSNSNRPASSSYNQKGVL